jgi:hypothetical protein
MHRRDLLLNLGAALATGRLLGRTLDELWSVGVGINRRLAIAAPAERGPLGPFSARQNETVLVVAEHILPRTDTPGARDARVNEFIAVMVDEWYDEEERTRFMDGLADLERRSENQFGTGFLEAEPARQEALLQGLETEASARRSAGEDTGRLFWPMIKGLTLYGYFTSELVQKQVLHTVITPGRFDGCVTT